MSTKVNPIKESTQKYREKAEDTMAVVAAPNNAMRDKTETCPIKVAMASKTNTPYT